MIDDDATNEAEVEAFREACRKFLAVYLDGLIKRAGLRSLAGTSHYHRSLIVDEKERHAVQLLVRFDFGELVEKAALAELIEAASSAPGTIPEA